MSTIHTKIEGKRGCGYRKKGGIYLVCDGPGRPCDKLPIALTVCPCCYAGIKQSRGFTWITTQLFSSAPCKGDCADCPLAFDTTPKRMGLLWVGEKYYPTADHFNREAAIMGISKRIAQVPKDFEVGKTWIALAHPKAVHHVTEDGKLEFGPGVFRAFCPQRMEYVVEGNETPEELEKLEKRGFTLVNIIPDNQVNKQGEML
jgi:hypothetical protein